MNAASPTPRRYAAWPATAPGRRAVTLFLIAASGVVLGIGLAGIWFGLLEPSGDGQESPPWWYTAPMFLAALTALLATIASAYFTVRALRAGERSLLLALPVGAALIALAFFVGEFAVPH